MDYKKSWEDLRNFLIDGIDYMDELKESKRKKSYEVVLRRMKNLENRED